MGSSPNLEPTTMGVEEQKPKRRRKLRDKSEEGVKLDDGYKWCKYGEKPKIDSMFIRSYYRCSNKVTNCTAKKTIDKHKSCKTRVNVTYNGEHNHPLPANKEVVVFHYKLHSGVVENVALASPNPENSGISSDKRCHAPATEGGETEGNHFPIWSGMENGVGIGLTQAPCFSTPSFSPLTCLQNYAAFPSLPPLHDASLPSTFNNPASACAYDPSSLAPSLPEPSVSLPSLPSSSSVSSDTSYGLDLQASLAQDQPLYYPLTDLDGFHIQDASSSLYSVLCDFPGLDPSEVPPVTWYGSDFKVDENLNPAWESSEEPGFTNSFSSKASDWDLFDYLIAQDQTNSPSASDVSFQSLDL